MDSFETDSRRVREQALRILEEVVGAGRAGCTLQRWNPEAPMGLCCRVTDSKGELVMELSAHAHAVNILLGPEARLLEVSGKDEDPDGVRLRSVAAAVVDGAVSSTPEGRLVVHTDSGDLIVDGPG